MFLLAAAAALRYWHDHLAMHLTRDRGPGRLPKRERHIAEAMAVVTCPRTSGQSFREPLMAD